MWGHVFGAYLKFNKLLFVKKDLLLSNLGGTGRFDSTSPIFLDKESKTRSSLDVSTKGWWQDRKRVILTSLTTQGALDVPRLANGYALEALNST